MPNMYLERLLEKRERLRVDAKGILDNAVAEDREVTDVERDSVAGMYRDAERLDAEIDPLHKQELRQIESDRQVAELERVTRARRQTEQETLATGGQLDRYRGKPGEYLADWGAKVRDPAAAQRIMRAQAEYRVVADQKLADNPGIVPTPVVGPLVGSLPTSRPFIESVANRPMPGGGSTFNRPSITQHTAVGKQSAEKAQLASQKMTIGQTAVSKATYGGTLDISFQDRDWTDPAILSIVVADLAAVYAQETDNAAADAFVTAATSTFVLADAGDAAATTAAILAAASAIYADVKRMPDTIWLSPDEWAKVAGLNGAPGVPAFSGLANATTMGAGSVLGLRTVVDGNFAAKTMVVGVASYAEHYEQGGSLLAVTEPTILGYTVAYYGYTADFMVDAKAFRKRSAT